MTAKGLDFLGIGVPKAGTTSLHEYMRTHPELYLPEAKEQHFFSRDDAFEEGWDAFAAVAFHAAPEDLLWGLITPKDLGGPVQWGESTAREADAPANVVTARRVAGTFPDVRLIALLRDPIERAISAYWQAVVLGDEERPIDEALAAQLSDDELRSQRAHPANQHQYIVVGEYGRLLEGWLESFERSQLFVGATSVLDREPMRLLGDLWRFLGVDDSHVPPNLGERYQTRGTGQRSRSLSALPGLVKRTPGLQHVWNAVPSGARDRVRARLRVADYRKEQRSHSDDERLRERPSPELLERLERHYADDLALLERLVGPVAGVTESEAPAGIEPA